MAKEKMIDLVVRIEYRDEQFHSEQFIHVTGVKYLEYGVIINYSSGLEDMGATGYMSEFIPYLALNKLSTEIWEDTNER